VYANARRKLDRKAVRKGWTRLPFLTRSVLWAKEEKAAHRTIMCLPSIGLLSQAQRE
jgi:hypothetical protein